MTCDGMGRMCRWRRLWAAVDSTSAWSRRMCWLRHRNSSSDWAAAASGIRPAWRDPCSRASVGSTSWNLLATIKLMSLTLLDGPSSERVIAFVVALVDVPWDIGLDGTLHGRMMELLLLLCLHLLVQDVTVDVHGCPGGTSSGVLLHLLRLVSLVRYNQNNSRYIRLKVSRI